MNKQKIYIKEIMKNNIRDWSNMAENIRKPEGIKEEGEKKYAGDANETTFIDALSLLNAAYIIIDESEQNVKKFLKTEEPLFENNKEKLIEVISSMLDSWQILHSNKEFPIQVGVKILKDLGYEMED